MSRREDSLNAETLVGVAENYSDPTRSQLLRLAHRLAPRVAVREYERIEAIRRRPRDEVDSWGSSVR